MAAPNFTSDPLLAAATAGRRSIPAHSNVGPDNYNNAVERARDADTEATEARAHLDQLRAQLRQADAEDIEAAAAARLAGKDDAGPRHRRKLQQQIEDAVREAGITARIADQLAADARQVEVDTRAERDTATIAKYTPLADQAVQRVEQAVAELRAAIAGRDHDINAVLRASGRPTFASDSNETTALKAFSEANTSKQDWRTTT